MNQFDYLSVDAKVAFLMTLSDLIIDRISQSEGFEVAVDALRKSWEWVKFKNIEAHSIYLYLENMDEQDIMTYMEFEEDSDREKVWICIGNAIAYTSWEAYHYEKEKYLPQTIESVDYETVESFINNFHDVYDNKEIAGQLLQYLELNYPLGTSKQVEINSIKNFVDKIISRDNANMHFWRLI